MNRMPMKGRPRILDDKNVWIKEVGEEQEKMEAESGIGFEQVDYVQINRDEQKLIVRKAKAHRDPDIEEEQK